MRRTFVVAALAAFAAAAPQAAAHQGNPNFRSTVTSIAPAAEGVEAEVVNLDDRLVLTAGGRTIEIEGYDGEPYVRILPDGTVQVNTRSPAYYLNEDRFAEVDVPPDADADAQPEWKTVSSSGRFEWHDHRIHWMARTTPPQVKDEGERTKVFDWTVPVRIDGEAASISGELVWVPDEGGFPLAAAISIAVIAALAIGLVLFVRRRRRRDGGPGEGSGAKEAW
jgi:hypothetical protein